MSAGPLVTRARAVGQVEHLFLDQPQGQAEQGLQARDTGFGLGEGALLGVRFVRLMVGADGGDGPVGHRAAQGIAVS